ncbi:hypothetical protein BDW59DRAFT_164373 [Aspergillus cavernicola]|uniref:Uncharacterized protein n=1 Tax=Aspergillus cavernicola TaxID=176166 RepID=A0ABR4HZP8_9EURO
MAILAPWIDWLGPVLNVGVPVTFSTLVGPVILYVQAMCVRELVDLDLDLDLDISKEHKKTDQAKMPQPSKIDRKTVDQQNIQNISQSASTGTSTDTGPGSGKATEFVSSHPQEAFERTMDAKGNPIPDAWSFTDGGKKKGHSGADDEADMFEAVMDDFDGL